jgi:hypothetical protein
MAALPGGRGYVELLTRSEGQAPSRGAARGARRSQIVAYFYAPDATTTLSPPPTDVQVKIGMGASNTSVALAPQMQTADSDSIGRFGSVPGSYPDGFQGQVDARIGSEEVSVRILVR